MADRQSTSLTARLSLGPAPESCPGGRSLAGVKGLAYASDIVVTSHTTRIRVAKAKGKLRGKQPKLNPRQETHLVDLYRQGEHSTAELADLFGVARSTVYRALERERARGNQPARQLGTPAGPAH